MILGSSLMSSVPSPHLQGKVVLVTGGTGSFGTALMHGGEVFVPRIRSMAEPIVAVV